MIPVDPAIEELELVTYAKDQPEYIPLPVRRDVHGAVVTCWKLSSIERVRMLLQGRFYLTILTFNSPLQPIRIEMDKPEASASGGGDTERS